MSTLIVFHRLVLQTSLLHPTKHGVGNTPFLLTFL